MRSYVVAIHRTLKVILNYPVMNIRAEKVRESRVTGSAILIQSSAFLVYETLVVKTFRE